MVRKVYLRKTRRRWVFAASEYAAARSVSRGLIAHRPQRVGVPRVLGR
jgi:hypothetical protein